MKKNIVKYNPLLKEIAGKLRKNGTPAEIRLWAYLKGKQLRGFDFHRQKPMDNFILDFYCPALKLAIEIDGSSHNDKYDIDKILSEKNFIGFQIFKKFEVNERNLQKIVKTEEKA